MTDDNGRTSMTIREMNWLRAGNGIYDIVIIGAGINGASLYRKLSSEGYRVLIVDKGDFSCGSSQASAMMIWGGLLYLRNLDIASVRDFSRDRDRLIAAYGEEIESRQFRYIVSKNEGRSKLLVGAALYVYWLLGRCRRSEPEFQRSFGELSIIKPGTADGSFLYEEGYLKHSDSRFVLGWILSRQTEHSCALNYCEVRDDGYNAIDRLWTLVLSDVFSDRRCMVKTRCIVNCAGVWTDSVNEQFQITSPYRHVFSKGVFLGFERPKDHTVPLIVEMGEQGDTLTLVPWGPLSLWGPTETMVHSIEEGFTVTHDDIRFLQMHAHRHLRDRLSRSPIISLRCGIRPLVVKKDEKVRCYPLDLSRHHKVIEDHRLPWISVYGGKISGCLSLANEVAGTIARRIPAPAAHRHLSAPRGNTIRWSTFPGVTGKVAAIDWCVEQEFCCTLEDYLRRRTTIAQWIPREGLGRSNENLGYLEVLASHLPKQTTLTRHNPVDEYVQRVKNGFDRLVPQSMKGDAHGNTSQEPAGNSGRKQGRHPGSWPDKQVA